MTGRRPAPIALVLLVAAVLAGCSGQPLSEVVTPDPGASVEAPSSGDGSAPASEPTAAPGEETTAPTAAPEIPPKPGDPTWKLAKSEATGTAGTKKLTYTAGWSSPDGVATSFALFGVTKCLRYAKETNGKPCLVKGMRIPKDVLVQIKEVPGDQRSTDVSYKSKKGSAPWDAVLVRAVNDAGESIFTILWSDVVCWKCSN